VNALFYNCKNFSLRLRSLIGLVSFPCIVQEFKDDYEGIKEVGKAADFTVFDRDILEVPEEEILQTKVQMTVVGGKVVFKR